MKKMKGTTRRRNILRKTKDMLDDALLQLRRNAEIAKLTNDDTRTVADGTVAEERGVHEGTGGTDVGGDVDGIHVALDAVGAIGSVDNAMGSQPALDGLKVGGGRRDHGGDLLVAEVLAVAGAGGVGDGVDGLGDPLGDALALLELDYEEHAVFG